jgi:DNA polymerase Ligase (LigD)
MPRFVVLEHDHPVLHWDLMLETGAVLRTWRLAEPPLPDKAIAAQALGDHRPFYLDYEGPVSGGRGVVKRWAAGTYDTLRESADLIEVRGLYLGKVATLRLTKVDSENWLFSLSIDATN